MKWAYWDGYLQQVFWARSRALMMIAIARRISVTEFRAAIKGAIIVAFQMFPFMSFQETTIMSNCYLSAGFAADGGQKRITSDELQERMN